ncbi:MAG TPA: hypothetical protein VLM05_07000 [Mycobacteriales bacterium]|nr:hypothetical protein [Mycobacteriales bacterium]
MTIEDLTPALAAPSMSAVRTTFLALDRTVASVGADCRSIAATLGALSDALDTITQGGGSGQQWVGAGLVGLPIAGAIKAARSLAGQYVKQQTGVPLPVWTELVVSSSAQFEAYLDRLEAVAAVSRRHHAAALQPGVDDQRVLLDARHETQAWKQVLGRVAQLGQLVDAILDAQRADEPAPDAGGFAGSVRSGSAFSGSVRTRLKEVQSRTMEKSGDLREWVLQPFVELRDRVRLLPRQIEHLAREVALLEVLLELEIAELRACLGQVPPAEARIVGLRVAAAVVLPELAERLADARRQAQDHRTYLDRLEDGRRSGAIDARTHAVLAAEYRAGLDGALAELAAVEAQADRWRREGPAVLRAGLDWVELELAVVAARALTEQRTTDERRVLLQREHERLTEAGRALAAL